MQRNVIDILLGDPSLNDARDNVVLRRALATITCAQDIDGQSDLLTHRMEERLKDLDTALRHVWKATWCAPTQSARREAAANLSQLKSSRREQRELYGFGMDCIDVLRSNHIDVLAWAIDRQSNAGSPAAAPADAPSFGTTFSIELEDGTEVVPCRLRDSATGLRSFKVSSGGNTNDDALLVWDEQEMCRYVIGIGYRVRCKARDGTRSGLYSARPPNKVRMIDHGTTGIEAVSPPSR